LAFLLLGVSASDISFRHNNALPFFMMNARLPSLLNHFGLLLALLMQFDSLSCFLFG